MQPTAQAVGVKMGRHQAPKERKKTLRHRLRRDATLGPSNDVEMKRITKLERGFTLMELIVATAILTILTMMAVPLARVTVQRQKEKLLHQALWDMRDAIDRYKDAADRQMFQTKVDSQGYPPDLETLVKGIEGQGGKKYRFLRSIPTDPMTNSKEWGMRSMQDDPDSDSWGGQNVFDVYTKSEGTGLDGTKYKDW
jgi:general secretion pathway protein G